jgi:hypothetical protein
MIDYKVLQEEYEDIDTVALFLVIKKENLLFVPDREILDAAERRLTSYLKRTRESMNNEL